MQVPNYFKTRRQEIYDEVHRIYAAVYLERELMQNFAVDEPAHVQFLDQTIKELGSVVNSIGQGLA